MNRTKKRYVVTCLLLFAALWMIPAAGLAIVVPEGVFSDSGKVEAVSASGKYLVVNGQRYYFDDQASVTPGDGGEPAGTTPELKAEQIKRNDTVRIFYVNDGDINRIVNILPETGNAAKR